MSDHSSSFTPEGRLCSQLLISSQFMVCVQMDRDKGGDSEWLPGVKFTLTNVMVHRSWMAKILKDVGFDYYLYFRMFVLTLIIKKVGGSWMCVWMLWQKNAVFVLYLQIKRSKYWKLIIAFIIFCSKNELKRASCSSILMQPTQVCSHF